MHIGAVYPQTELRGDPAAVRRIGQAVEDLGFDHLPAYDHVLGAIDADRTPPLTGPYTEHDPFHDPFVMFGYLAGITRRIGVVSGVLILPQRQTALVARQEADVGLLSGGRVAARRGDRLESGRIRGARAGFPHSRRATGGAARTPAPSVHRTRHYHHNYKLHVHVTAPSTPEDASKAAGLYMEKFRDASPR